MQSSTLGGGVRPGARLRRFGAGRVAGLILVGALGLQGCVEGSGGRPAPQSVRVADGQLTLSGPEGFCVDTAESRTGKRGSFVLFGSCASLSGSPFAARPQDPAILTATVVGETGAGFDARSPQLASFLGSARGRAAVSRSGKAASVRILGLSAADNVLYIRLSDSAPAAGQSVEAEYWRALLAVGPRIISLSVLGLQSKPLPSAKKRAILERFVARVRSANKP